MPYEEMDKASDVLDSLKPHFLLVRGPYRWKFYSHKSRKIRNNLHWKFPFLDISVYKTYHDGTKKIIEDSHKFYAQFKFNYSDVFPLIKRPFEGLMLNAPRHSRKILTTTYCIEECASNKWVHKIEREARTQSVIKCEHLKSIFPFVSHKKVLGGINETLEKNGTVLSWWLDHTI